MSRLGAVPWTLALAMAAGCGSGGETECTPAGSHFTACGESGAMAEAVCRATTCSGDKQRAIGCVVAASCGDLAAAVASCEAAEGCSVTSATCADVVDYVNGCIDAMGVSVARPSVADCDATRCTGSKQQALNCALGLTCSPSLESELADCGAAQGCS
jgi:hypothetical protein